ncbi:MAG: hypothetical protein K2L72_01545 [Clostridia bacterium]|nr:hypothetical protein [Clostridia bacterium]
MPEKYLHETEKFTAPCRYPIVLVHGVMLKDFKFLRAFGRIEKILRRAGHIVYTAKIDGFGTIESNAVQLKKYIDDVRIKEKAEKVNLIAHSKGGLDSRYMIENLEMGKRVASLTTLCTPHKGSQIASQLLRLPKSTTAFIAFWVNFWYKLFGDEKPNALQVCKQLQSIETNEDDAREFLSDVYCQSYSATLNRSRDDFIMGIPLVFSKRFEKSSSDGLVTPSSSKFGDYKGDCLDGSVSHLQIVGYAAGKKKKEKIYAFYLQLCNELAQKGY